jgi:hypothetical protein
MNKFGRYQFIVEDTCIDKDTLDAFNNVSKFYTTNGPAIHESAIDVEDAYLKLLQFTNECLDHHSENHLTDDQIINASKKFTEDEDNWETYPLPFTKTNVFVNELFEVPLKLLDNLEKFRENESESKRVSEMIFDTFMESYVKRAGILLSEMKEQVTAIPYSKPTTSHKRIML